MPVNEGQVALGLETPEQQRSPPPRFFSLFVSTNLRLALHLSMQDVMILVDHFSVSDLNLASPADLACIQALAQVHPKDCAWCIHVLCIRMLCVCALCICVLCICVLCILVLYICVI